LLPNSVGIAMAFSFGRRTGARGTGSAANPSSAERYSTHADVSRG